jgi:hypothetical protein
LKSDSFIISPLRQYFIIKPGSTIINCCPYNYFFLAFFLAGAFFSVAFLATFLGFNKVALAAASLAIGSLNGEQLT